MDEFFDHLHHSASSPPGAMLFEQGTQWSSPEEDDNISITSTDSNRSRLGNLLRRATTKGKRLVHRRKRRDTKLLMVDQTFQTDTSLTEPMVESISMPSINFSLPNDPENDSITSAGISLQHSTATFSGLSSDQPSQASLDSQQPDKGTLASFVRSISFLKFRIGFGLLLIALTILLPYWMASFFWGVYVTVFAFLSFFVSKPFATSIGETTAETLQNVSKEADRQKALKEVIRYQGWMNELRGRYNPLMYSVQMTHSVLVELEAKTLRLAQPKRNVFKHTFYNDPSLRAPEPQFIRHRVFDLTDATVSLRPHGLARRRWWNRKYPIVIKFAPQTQFLEIDDNDDSGTDLSLSEREWLNEKHTSASKVRRRWTISRSSNDVSNKKAVEEVRTFVGSKKLGVRGKRVVLFARSSREKERWFHRLRVACSMNRTGADAAADSEMKRASNMSLPSLFDEPMDPGDPNDVNANFEYFLYVSYGMQFSKTMAEVMKSSSVEYSPESGVIHLDLDKRHWSPKAADFKSEVVLAANAIVARLYFDFCRDERWIQAVRHQIECKLHSIELPYFIETLTLSQLKLGTTIPQVIGVHAPVLNDWGLWVDIEMKYDGGIQLALETKVDMRMLMEGKPTGFKKVTLARLQSDAHRHYSDSELSYSPETSDDEHSSTNSLNEESKGGVGKKILSMMGKVARSHLFHNAAELGPIRKVMEGISSTRLMLNVEVTLLEGTLAVNIPPPPSDRLWYGFRRPPKFALKAVPQVGDRIVEMSTVSNWIETRLHTLLEKNLVVPNMANLVVPVMAGNEMLKFGYTD